MVPTWFLARVLQHSDSVFRDSRICSSPIGGGLPRRTLCCRTRCGSHFHSYGFAPWSPQSFLSSRTKGVSVGRPLPAIPHHAYLLPVPVKSGLTSAPRLPQTLQVKGSSMPDSLRSSGHSSALTAMPRTICRAAALLARAGTRIALGHFSRRVLRLLEFGIRQLLFSRPSGGCVASVPSATERDLGPSQA